MSKVSFVCPIYNKKKYLPYVLKSIKEQKGSFEKEYIFINDGSQDGSLEYLKKSTSKWKNILIINQTNKGPASATQLGITRANGDFIKLVGGDDIMAPFCTELLLTMIKKSKTVAVFSNYELLDNYKNINYQNDLVRNLRVINKPLLQTIKSSYSGTTPNLFCNKSIRISGGCEEKIFVEDFSLVLGLSNLGNFCFIDNITSYGPKKAQLMHDYNAALYYFFKSNPKVNPSIQKVACIKSLGRAEKWYRREFKGNKFNRMNFYKFLIYLGKNDYLEMIKKSCYFFYKDSKDNLIRYKIS
jgi:glycosyltransferase involved in cell wall biosynthesis